LVRDRSFGHKTFHN